MAKGKKQPQKLADIKLTDHEREVLAEGFNSEFFKIIEEKILPQRRIQLSLTIAEADQSMDEVWYHRGMIRMCSWLPQWIKGKAETLDDSDYDNDDNELSAEDEKVV